MRFTLVKHEAHTGTRRSCRTPRSPLTSHMTMVSDRFADYHRGMAKSKKNTAGEMAPTMMASEFKARCLGLLDWVALTGNELTVTKHGKPVARLVPVESHGRAPLGRSVTILTDDEDELFTTGESWGVPNLPPARKRADP